MSYKGSGRPAVCHARRVAKTLDSGLCRECYDCMHPAKDRKLKDRIQRYRYAYGISIDDYDKLLVQQKGLCSICGEPPKDGRFLCVDHDHNTKKVRGLLCDNCNTGLGMFRDNIDILMKVINYLKRSYD